MNVNKPKKQKQKIQSLKKENEHDHKKEDIIDPENFSKNLRSENKLYEEFFSVNKEAKNQEIIKQFPNSKKSTNITEGNKNTKNNNIIKTTLDYDASQKMFIEKEKKIINIQNPKIICLQKKTKLNEASNNKNNLNNILNINVNKNLNKNVNNINHSIKNNESKNNVKNDEYHNSPNIEINEDLIDELSKSEHEEDENPENKFYNEINELIDEEFIQENNEDECIPEIEEHEIGSINSNQRLYKYNKIKEQDMQSMQDMLEIDIHHPSIDSSNNSITHNCNNLNS